MLISVIQTVETEGVPGFLRVHSSCCFFTLLYVFFGPSHRRSG